MIINNLYIISYLLVVICDPIIKDSLLYLDSFNLRQSTIAIQVVMFKLELVEDIGVQTVIYLTI